MSDSDRFFLLIMLLALLSRGCAISDDLSKISHQLERIEQRISQ